MTIWLDIPINNQSLTVWLDAYRVCKPNLSCGITNGSRTSRHRMSRTKRTAHSEAADWTGWEVPVLVLAQELIKQVSSDVSLVLHSYSYITIFLPKKNKSGTATWKQLVDMVASQHGETSTLFPIWYPYYIIYITHAGNKSLLCYNYRSIA